MKQTIHILYLSGFGAKHDSFRLRALSHWRFRGVTVELVPMRWESDEAFEQKIARLDQAIDRAVGKQIVLLGESAGGSVAVHMYARRPDDFYKVMTLCGKNSHPETVGESYYQRSPAFRTSMQRLNDAIATLTLEQRQQFVSIHPLYDPVVPVRETLLPGCRQVRLWLAGHFFTIVIGLTILSPIIIRTIKK